VGDAQRLTPEEQIRTAREQYEEATDLTLAVEEEFAILDPPTLSLTNRFEELQAAAAGTPLEEHLVGELIASEVEIRTGRCDDFEEASARLGERRAQLAELAGSLGVTLGATGTHPWSPWQEQRIIDTPHYRRNDELLRYVVWRNNSFGLHVHVAIKGPDRAIAVCNGLRNFLPELLALSCSSPFLEGVNTGLHSARTQIFTRTFPRCGIPDAYDGWDGFERYVRFLYETRSIDEHTQLWWSVRPHLAFPTVEIRICDAQPDLGEARSLSALCYALTARIARAVDEGEPLPSYPHRLIEENFWRAIRYGLSGEFIDLASGDVRSTRAHLERLVEWVLPVAEELGCASAIAIPATNAAERQIARHEEGASLEEVYAEQVGPEAPLAAPPSGRTGSARASVGNDRSSRTGSETDAPEEPVRG
jgi:carboxylate-amine ligase